MKLLLKIVFICSVWIFHVTWLHAETKYPELEVCLKLIKESRFEEAREKLNQFSRSHPENPRALFYLAQLEEDFTMALALLKKVEILATQFENSVPDSNLASEAVFARAEMIFSEGNLSVAADIYERLINIYPTSDFISDAHYRLGIISLVSGFPDNALNRFKTSLEIDSKGKGRILTKTGIMECYVELKNWPEVLAAAHEALEEIGTT